jgi:hypothetical protein
MLRRLFLLLPVLCGLLLAAPALACECDSAPVDPEQYLRDATLVFEGEVLSTPLSSWVLNTVTIRVLSPMKGRLGDEVVLHQSAVGNCAADFEAGGRVRIVAHGSAEERYHTSACLLGPLWRNDQGDEIWTLATANRQHTLALGGSTPSADDVPTLRRLIRWHAEYGSFEEGLDAVERLLELEPGDPEALQFKARFQSR